MTARCEATPPWGRPWGWRPTALVLLVSFALLVSGFPALAARADEEPRPGDLVVLVPGDSLPGPGFWIDEARLRYYLDVELERDELRTRLELAVALDERENAYTTALERRVKALESPVNRPSLHLAIGVAIGIVGCALAALGAYGFHVAFSGGIGE